MPYVSDKQRRFFHSEGAAEAGIKPSTVHEFDEASKGKKLPESHCKSCEREGTKDNHRVHEMAESYAQRRAEHDRT